MENGEYKVKDNHIIEERGREVSFTDVLKKLISGWWLIAAAVFVAALLALLYAKFLVKPTYQACFTAYVNNKQSKQANDELTNSDILASQELVETYSKVLKGNKVLMKAAERLGEEYDLKYTYKDLSEMVSTQPQDGTEIITVLVTAGSSKEAYRVCSAIEEISPECMADIIEGSSMKIVDTTQEPDMRHSPSYTKYTVIGAIIGALAAVSFILIRMFLDDKVSDESELEKRYTIPVVGVIPDMSKTSPDGYGYYKYGGYYKRKSKEQNKNTEAGD